MLEIHYIFPNFMSVKVLWIDIGVVINFGLHFFVACSHLHIFSFLCICNSVAGHPVFCCCFFNVFYFILFIFYFILPVSFQICVWFMEASMSLLYKGSWWLYSGAQIPRYKGFVKHSSAQEENAGPKVKHTRVNSDTGAFVSSTMWLSLGHMNDS